MRHLLVGLFLGIFIAVSIANTQQQPEHIYIGTTIQIGMTKDAAISQLAEKGYHVTKPEGSETWFVFQKDEHSNEFEDEASLAFTNGRVTFASRRWAYTTDPGSAKLARNLYFLVKSLEESDNTACAVETKAQESPELDSKGIMIRCGKKTVQVNVAKYKEQLPETVLDEYIK